MLDYLKRTWAEINIDNLVYNYNSVKKIVRNECKILVSVKGDAYGHGAPFVAKKLEAAGADYFGVSNLEEAIQLRQSGVKKPILIFGYTPIENVRELFKHDITQTVYSSEYAAGLSTAVVLLNSKLKVHIKIDTGMSRLGFICNNKEQISKCSRDILKVIECKNFDVEGVFTHFAVSDEPKKKDFTTNQFEYFMSIINEIEKSGFKFKIKHCCNSAGIINFPEMHLDMVRPGIVLYGLMASRLNINIKPVMSIKTVVSFVKKIEKGVSVSYGRKYLAPDVRTIATLPIGYADSYSRKFSNNGKVLINGKVAQIVGYICMDQCMVDITNIGDVTIGDLVTIVGTDGDNTIMIDELADQLGTIPYEVACLLNKRVPRVFIEEGRQIGVQNVIIKCE